ncbi:DUF3077 domain-containing protein [Pseudomonas sp. 65/3-MNA-CIBAN-0223]|uniref:DUF6124 family protein n=1 Tax=Pseudomonas sp. 65/3-MNA-CIBAN-0223 TaxID=3140476 RepID=UPI00333492C8
MAITSTDLPDEPMDTALNSPQGFAAAQRALDHYLKPAVSAEPEQPRFFAVNKNVSSEEALVHASDLMRCAASIAYESASNLRGASRDLTLSTVHLIDMARAMVDRSLDEGKKG